MNNSPTNSPSVQDSAKTAGLLGENQERSTARTEAHASGPMTEATCALCGGKILSHHPRWIAAVDRVCLDCIGQMVDDALNRRVDGQPSSITQIGKRTGADAGTFLRAALSDHGTGPLAPEEMRRLADDLEDALITYEMQFSDPDWRYVDGLRASASALELAVDRSWSTPNHPTETNNDVEVSR